MLFGNKKTFAIECEITEQIDDWVFGHFLFWLCDNSIGDREDSTDLKGCLMWLKDFLNTKRNRFEREIINIDKYTLFDLLYNSVIPTNEKCEHEAKFDDIFSRFHISHIGMSSFDNFDILLIELPHKIYRCLWRSVDNKEIKECYIPKNDMENITKICSDWLENEIKYFLLNEKSESKP